MPFYFFIWDDENERHLSEHGVTPEEFESVVCDPEASAKVARLAGQLRSG